MLEAGRVRGPQTAVCDECRRGPLPAVVTALRRAAGPSLDPDKCLLAQGVLCGGPATRAGCGATCVSQQSPCIGCYGANGGGDDFVERLLAVLAGLLPVDPEQDDPEKGLAAAGLPQARTLFRQFTLEHERLRRRVQAILVERDMRSDA